MPRLPYELLKFGEEAAWLSFQSKETEEYMKGAASTTPFFCSVRPRKLATLTLGSLDAESLHVRR